MSKSVIIILRLISINKWRLFTENDIPISQPFHGDKYNALEWGKNWISSWSNWIIQIEDKNEKD